MMKVKELHIKPVKKGDAKAVEAVRLLKDFGPEGDAYGGPGDRQITLLGEDDIEELQKDSEKGLCIKRFTPNVTTTDSSSELVKGNSYKIGDAVIKVTSVAKKCHEGCLLRDEEKRICLLPKTARFASIIEEGTASISDRIESL